ncbi:hypothetical protein IO210_004615 [Salmonella enterica]|nr:hypothetical protein [Salmonella enterica]
MRRPLTARAMAEGVYRAVEQSNRIERICVLVELPHASIGARPSVAMVDFSTGFDWDSGTLFLHPEQPLTPLSPAELEEIKQCRADGQSWAVFKAFERWQLERDELVDTILKLRSALLTTGMSTAELELLAGLAPQARPKRRSESVARRQETDDE